jgi:hypothetical protein
MAPPRVGGGRARYPLALLLAVLGAAALRDEAGSAGAPHDVAAAVPLTASAGASSSAVVLPPRQGASTGVRLPPSFAAEEHARRLGDEALAPLLGAWAVGRC